MNLKNTITVKYYYSTKQIPSTIKYYDNIYGYSTLIRLLLLQNKFQNHRVSNNIFLYKTK